MMAEGYINKYRPNSFEEVVGHVPQVKSLQKALKDNTARAFLFTGGSGYGKTTLARIVAKEAGCRPGDRLEIDASTNTGIDAMRSVMDSLMYRPVGGGDIKAVIVDEAHGLSKQAQDSLLKILEEPPDWVYWFLCTTELSKMRPTFKTRCLHLDLKAVQVPLIKDLLLDVVAQEKLKLPKGVVDLCAEEAGGSPRQALSNLAACAAAENLEEAEELLSSAVNSAEAVDLARLLIRGAKWGEVVDVLKRLKDADPESVRRVVQAYFSSVILGAKSESQAGRTLEILDAFSQPMYHHSGLVLACGKVLLS